MQPTVGRSSALQRGLEEEAKNGWVTILLVGVGAALVVGIVVVFYFKRCQRRKAPQFEDFVDPYAQDDTIHNPHPGKAPVVVEGTHASRFHQLAFQHDLDNNSLHPSAAPSTQLPRPPASSTHHHRQTSGVALLEENVVMPAAPFSAPLSSRRVVSNHAAAPRPPPTGRSVSAVVVDRFEPSVVAQQRIEDFRPPKRPKKPTSKASVHTGQTAAESRAAKKAALISQLGGTGMANNMKMIQSTWQAAKAAPGDAPAKPDVITFLPSSSTSRYQLPSTSQTSSSQDQQYNTDANQPHDSLPLGAEAGSYGRRKKPESYEQDDEAYVTDANHPDDTLPLGAEAGTYRQKAELLQKLQAPPPPTKANTPPSHSDYYRPFEDNAAYETSQAYDSMPLGAEAGQYHQFLQNQKKTLQIQHLGR
ncbi:hypothetical protein DYB25_000903 [Aphanomyces astaci]|uniref:Uncharacterized protein n=1 Tax=Aphanomyces astaci TaxID=112090 RepID=A0A397B4S5_APHAT|nr:hypothetical protein DYB25_000903 [Aphanomyces astaci]